MTRFISVDPSTTFTGWAVFQDEGLVAWGKIDLRNVEYSFRFQYVVNELIHLCQLYHFQEIAMEDVKVAWHSKNRYRNIAGLQIIFKSIKEWAKGVNLPLVAHPHPVSDAGVPHVVNDKVDGARTPAQHVHTGRPPMRIADGAYCVGVGDLETPERYPGRASGHIDAPVDRGPLAGVLTYVDGLSLGPVELAITAAVGPTPEKYRVARLRGGVIKRLRQIPRTAYRSTPP